MAVLFTVTIEGAYSVHMELDGRRAWLLEMDVYRVVNSNLHCSCTDIY
jgi:hypothetical protein